MEEQLSVCYCKLKWEVKTATFHLRISKRSSEKDTFSCSFCEGSRILPPLCKPVAVLPCCMMEVHLQCRNAAVRARMNCPGCGFPPTIKGFIALERAEGKSIAIYYFKPGTFLLRKKSWGLFSWMKEPVTFWPHIFTISTSGTPIKLDHISPLINSSV